METLNNTIKITLATLKSFAKRNADKLFVKEVSEFNGMTDCVETNRIAEFKPTEMNDKKGYFRTGIQGVYTVGSSRDYFTYYSDGTFTGIEVTNSCGTTILAVKNNEA